MKSREKHKYDLSRRRRSRKKSKINFFIFGALIFAAGFLFLVRTPDMRIGSIEVVNNDQNFNAEEIQNIKEKTKEFLRGDYFWVIPKDSIFFYPQEELERELLAAFPVISDLKLSASPWEGLALAAGARLTSAVWCGEPGCYFMDDRGFIFEKANQTIGLKFEGLIQGDPLKQTFGDPDLISFLKTFAAEMDKLGLKTDSIKVYGRDKAEANLTGGSVVIFSPNPGEAEKLYDNLTLLISNLKEKNGGVMPDFEYIDARYGNKIFYKLK